LRSGNFGHPATPHVGGRRLVIAFIAVVARPADLPFEQPTRFRLVIKKKTLETHDLTIPPAMLMRAGEVVD
jgi:hypothetical protein